LNIMQLNACLFFAASRERHLEIASWICCLIKTFPIV
jgi:hypothetical protein